MGVEAEVGGGVITPDEYRRMMLEATNNLSVSELGELVDHLLA